MILFRQLSSIKVIQMVSAVFLVFEESKSDDILGSLSREYLSSLQRCQPGNG